MSFSAKESEEEEWIFRARVSGKKVSGQEKQHLDGGVLSQMTTAQARTKPEHLINACGHYAL